MAARLHWGSDWFHRVGGAPYAFILEHRTLASPFGRLLWGWDVDMFYDSMSAIAEVPDGGAVLDMPCGGGVALRGLRPGQHVRYVAADLSRGMLDRTRAVAARRRLTQVEYVEADVTALPFGDASFDLCLCFNGLHCFPDPAAAIGELARCLRPGASLVGDTVVRGAHARYDAQIALYRRAGVFGRVPRATDLWHALNAAGLEDVRLDPSGAVVQFAASAPG